MSQSKDSIRWNGAMNKRCCLFAGCVVLGALSSPAWSAEPRANRTDGGASRPISFSPQTVRVWDKGNREYVWRERCGNNNEDHQMAGGFEWVGDSRDFISLGEAWVRDQRRGGLLMLSFPNGNVLNARLDVNLPEGHPFTLQYALTDWTARLTSNGLKFTVVATDADGKEHKLLEEVLEKGDQTVREKQFHFEYAVQSLTFTHDNLGQEFWDVLWIYPDGLVVPKIPPAETVKPPAAIASAQPRKPNYAALRSAIEDLIETFPNRYRRGREFLDRLEHVQQQAAQEKPDQTESLAQEFEGLQREALIANPLVSAQPILFVVRHQYRSHYHAIDTLFHTGEFNPDRGIDHAELFQGGGAMKMIDLAGDGEAKTMIEVPDGVARDPDLHFDADRVVFAMRRNRQEDYHICEINVDGSGLRQLTTAADVCDFDPIYLPDDSIVFSSTREPKYNMCSRDSGANLFRMEADGANIHQITKNTLFDNHASLLPDGRILYARWEYVDRNFGDAHGLWTVDPAGTNQAVYWGNNTAVPGAVFNAHLIPDTQRFVCILGPHHDRLWGAMGIIDRRMGIDGRRPVLRTWPAAAAGSVRIGGAFDCDHHARSVRIKYEDPWPLSDKYFLCSRMIGKGEQTGIYLLDVFGNEILLHTEGPGCYDPMPVRTRPRPPNVSARRDFTGGEGILYVADVYQGTHMQGVKRGSVKYLRVVESPEKRHWSPGRWNGQGYTAPGMNWHSLENKRILGSVPVEKDGSAHFSVPSDTFVYFQLLDEKGMMIQSMRSGTVLQSGERTGCVGCHEERRGAAQWVGESSPLALQRPPSRLDPWYGPPRLFGFAAEVQPVLDKHCVGCHDYGEEAGSKLNLAPDRTLAFNTAYNELWRKGYVKSVGGGPAEVQQAYSWGSHASKLVQVLRDPEYPGHETVALGREELDRIITWVDLNAVYYPTYSCAYPNSRTGRCPLDQKQLGRLSELTGVNFNNLMNYHGNRGPQVSFDRPELSPCLAKFDDKDDSRYKEALSIIEAGTRMLDKRPRADMPGFRPCDVDQRREEKYALRQQVERRNREAIRSGRKVYDDRQTVVD